MNLPPIFTTAAIFRGSVLNLLLTIGGILAVVLLLSIPWYIWFQQELRYINSEIQRTEGAVQERWKQRKRRLLLSIIPGIKYE